MGKYTVEWLRDNENGIDVCLVNEHGHRNIIKNVHPNVVRCTIGESDTEYLLAARNRECFCRINEAEMQDFIKNVVK